MFYIKKRNNPQFDSPYFVACGKLTKARAGEIEKTLYGESIMIPYATETE